MSLDYNIISESFKSIHQDLNQWTETFFQCLLNENPRLKPFFINSNMDNVKKNFASTVSMIIDNIQHDELLTDSVKHLALRHMQYGAVQEDYPIFGTALINSIKQSTTYQWNEQTQEAWEQAFDKIQNIAFQAIGEYQGLLAAG